MPTASTADRAADSYFAASPVFVVCPQALHHRAHRARFPRQPQSPACAKVARNRGFLELSDVARGLRDVMVMNTEPHGKKSDGITVPSHPHTLRDASTVAGAAAGAAVGAIAGPVGAIAGGLVGTAIGALAGQTLDEKDAEETEHDQKLDRDIGVTKGDLGAASPDQPPARRGVYSAASAGVSGGGGSVPSEGPMQDLDSD